MNTLEIEFHKKLLVKINLEKYNDTFINGFQAKPSWCTGYQLVPYGLIYIKYKDLMKQGFSVPDFANEFCLEYNEEPLIAFSPDDLDIMTE